MLLCIALLGVFSYKIFPSKEGVKMKKTVLILLSFILVLSFSSCSDVYEETIVSDIQKYDDIWKLPEKRVFKTSVLFPSIVTEEQCVAFTCKHTTYQLLGTGWQIFLEIKYDDPLYLVETERLNNLCANSPVCGYSEYYDDFAYATVWNWNCCFEYAVVDQNKKTVCYVYLQLIQKNNLIIDEKYIPKEYEMELSDSEIYSIYE